MNHLVHPVQRALDFLEMYVEDLEEIGYETLKEEVEDVILELNKFKLLRNLK